MGNALARYLPIAEHGLIGDLHTVTEGTTMSDAEVRTTAKRP
jgi:hypothetical protein